METKIKVIDITPVVTTDIYFEDSSKWTLTKTGPSSYNTSKLLNNDLNLVIGRKGTLPGNIATAVNTGVVLDTTKEYLMFIKVNNNSNYQSNFTICGINFNNIPQGKEIIRRFKPTTTSLEFKLAQKVTNNSISANITKDKVIIDYCRIVEYDLKYLDVMKTEDILYQSNVKDIYEPDKVKSDYTKSFELPGSYTNNRFFSHWYRVSANGDFDHNVKMPVIIQKGEIDIIEGYMYLNEVKINASEIVYNVTIIAEMANIWDEISTLKLTDLDLSEYNHAIDMVKMYVTLPENGTVASPTSTQPSLVNTIWTYETQKTGVMSYLTMPNGTTRAKITLSGHGYQEGDFVRVSTRIIPPSGGSPFVISSLCGDFIVEGVFDANTFYINCPAPTITNGGTLQTFVKKKNFTGNGWYYAAINRGHTTKNLMTPSKSKPQIFVKGIWDKIFKEAGYRYTSEFLNTNYFKSLCADLVTKEITQLSDDLKSQNVEARNTYAGTPNQMGSFTGPTTDNRKFLKTTWIRNDGQDSCGYIKRRLFKDYQGGISYGDIFSHDLSWGTELVDLQGLLSSSGVWTPKLSGDYQFNVQLTVGVSMINNSMTGNCILPQKQTFKKTSHWAGIDNDMDGTPASTNLWVYNKGARDGNSGMVFWLEIQQVSDSKVVWTSAEYLATPSERSVSKYDYNEGYVDINQTAALFLKKDVGYKIVLKYTRNQRLFMGAECGSNNKWRWGTSFVEYGPFCGPSFYTEIKAPNSFGAQNWSVWLLGNNETTKLHTSIQDPSMWKQITGYNYVKFELIQSVSEGSDVYLKHFISDMTQTEFLASVNKMFNLHWYWDRNNKQYIIEPFYNFYNQEELDWTKKVDLNSDIVLEPLDNSKKYILKYKDSSDYYNKDYKDAFGTTYGESNVISANEIATEEKTIESGFSLGVLVQFPVKPLNTMVMPTYSSQNIGNNTSVESNSTEGVFIYICGGSQYTQTPMLLDDGNATQTQVWESVKYDHFPFAGHIDSTYAPYYDICYANPAQFSYTMKNYTTHNLYNKFWRDWFNLMLNKEQKLITYYMNLTDVDIFNLDYAKRYVINGEPLRLVSISDYNLNANNLAKVQFIKDIGSKVFIPKTISNTGGNFPTIDEPDFPWVESPWAEDNPWRPIWDDYEPGGGIYNPISRYEELSFLDSRSRTTAQTTFQQKDKNTGNSAQFDSINMGFNNTDVGGENYVTGNSNRVFGSGNFVSGRNNQVKSQNTIVMGDNIKAVRPGIYFQDVYIDELGVIHNATNVFNGGSNTTNYVESVNNLYKPNVLGLISGTGSPTNPFAGVMEIQNPNLQFSRIIGVDIRHDDIDDIRNY